jgi:2-iminobutanoate/2-iminopropanoate deaminase
MKKIFNISGAPAPLGPYSQAVMMGNMLFISGQVPIDPITNVMISGTIQELTVRVMENIKSLLQEAGMDFSHIVKTSIFLADMNDFAAVNETYAAYFSKEFPARETIQAARLPKDARVEISVIAIREN